MPENLELHQFDGSIQGNTSNNFLSKFRCACPYLGILLATLSSFFFSLCSVIVKGLVDVNPMELASFRYRIFEFNEFILQFQVIFLFCLFINRFVGVLLPAIPIVIYKKQPVFPKGKRIILILRCFMGTTGLILSFYAFRHMPLADASVIIFSTPVFVAIFARLFLKEPCSYFNMFTIILTLIGVVLITRPPFIFDDITPSLGDTSSSLSSSSALSFTSKNDKYEISSIILKTHNQQKLQHYYDIWGPVAAISSTLFGANVYILLRALKNLHFSVIMTNFGCFALIYTLIICWSINIICWPKCGYERLLIIILAIFSFLGQILLTLSLKIEQAGPVSIARCSDIVFAFIWQIIFFNEIPNLYSLFGAILVVSSVILTALKKWLISLPRDSKLRKKLQFLTND